MDLISSGQVVHAGTYNSNPVVIAAGLATLQTLSGDREAVYSRLNRLGGRLRQGLEDRLRRAEVPALVGGLGPVVQVSLTNRESLDDYRQWATRDDRTYQQLVTDLVYRGVRTTGRGTWYVSTRPHRGRRGPDAGCVCTGPSGAQRGIGLLIPHPENYSKKQARSPLQHCEFGESCEAAVAVGRPR